MEKQTQISAPISASTREQLERYTRATGRKKGYVIEQALLHYLAAVEEIPEEFIIPSRIVLTRESGEKLLDLIENPRPPTPALRKLMKGRR